MNKKSKNNNQKSTERKNNVNVILFRCVPVQHPPPPSDHQIRKATIAVNVNIANCNKITKPTAGPAVSTPLCKKFKRMV